MEHHYSKYNNYSNPSNNENSDENYNCDYKSRNVEARNVAYDKYDHYDQYDDKNLPRYGEGYLPDDTSYLPQYLPPCQALYIPEPQNDISSMVTSSSSSSSRSSSLVTYNSDLLFSTGSSCAIFNVANWPFGLNDTNSAEEEFLLVWPGKHRMDLLHWNAVYKHFVNRIMLNVGWSEDVTSPDAHIVADVPHQTHDGLLRFSYLARLIRSVLCRKATDQERKCWLKRWFQWHNREPDMLPHKVIDLWHCGKHLEPHIFLTHDPESGTVVIHLERCSRAEENVLYHNHLSDDS